MVSRDTFSEQIVLVGNVYVSTKLFTVNFCCDLDSCHGRCCVEGESGAPVTTDEVMEIEDSVDEVWKDLSASAQTVIDKQGVAYTDIDGDLVTSIVNGKDCVFTCYDKENCLCSLEKRYREGSISFVKPISCALYPVREKDFHDGTFGINYHKWDICKDAIKKGEALQLPLYKFLEVPLKRRFGVEWYDELSAIGEQIFLLRQAEKTKKRNDACLF